MGKEIKISRTSCLQGLRGHQGSQGQGRQHRKSRLLARTHSTELKDDDDGSRWGNARRSGRRSPQKDEKRRISQENLRRRVSVVACQISSDVWDWCLRSAGNDRVRSHGTPTTIKLPQTLFH